MQVEHADNKHSKQLPAHSHAENTSSKNISVDFSGEVLTLGEFAQRMRTCRTTVYEMIAKGRLLPGRHFIMMGNKRVFPWGGQLLRYLLEDSINFESKGKRAKRVAAQKPVAIVERQRQSVKKNLPYINLEY